MKKEDEIARSERIAKQLRELQRLKREQDRHVGELTARAGAWALEHAEVPEVVRDIFETARATTSAHAPMRAHHALRG